VSSLASAVVAIRTETTTSVAFPIPGGTSAVVRDRKQYGGPRVLASTGERVALTLARVVARALRQIMAFRRDPAYDDRSHWVADATVAACFECQAPFTTLRRRYRLLLDEGEGSSCMCAPLTTAARQASLPYLRAGVLWTMCVGAGPV
jgi:hypothetical protein